MSQLSNRGKSQRRLARKAPRVFLGVAIAATSLGLYGATTSNADVCKSQPGSFFTSCYSAAGNPGALGGIALPQKINYGTGTNTDGYSDSAREAYATITPKAAPATPAAPVRNNTPSRNTAAKKPPAIKRAAGTGTSTCTATGEIKVPEGTPFAGGDSHKKYCEHTDAALPVYAVSEKQFDDTKLNISVGAKKAGTLNTGDNFYVCQMQKTDDNKYDVWVLTEADSPHVWGWVHSWEIKGHGDDGKLDKVPNCDDL